MVQLALIFSGLTATSVLEYTLIGQSNATENNGNSVSAALQAWATTNSAATINISNYALSGRGFGVGFGNGDVGRTGWPPAFVQGSAFITGVQTTKASSTADTYYSPVIIIQGEYDAQASDRALEWEAQVTNLKTTFEDTVGINLPWVVVRLNNSSALSDASTVIAQQNSFIANNADVYLVDIDDQTLQPDGLHYDGPAYTVIEERIRSVIDANNLLTLASAAERAPTSSVTGSGVSFESSFTGTSGADASTATNTTGSFSVANGSMEIHSSGSGLVISGADPGGPGYLLDVDTMPTGEIIQIEMTLNHTGGNTTAGPTLRKGALSDEFIALFLRNASNDVARLFRYDGSYSSFFSRNPASTRR